MANKITYLLGAGASKNAIPIVENFISGETGLIKAIAAFEALGIKPERYDGWNEQIPITKLQVLEKFKKEAQSIIKSVEDNHTTIDNYARMLFLTEQFPELKKLKAVIMVYLMWVQLENRYDKRYDLFLSTILSLDSSVGLKLPESIQIISWNYDFQFELAAAKYIGSNKNLELQEFLNTSSIINTALTKMNQDVFCLIKLNGTALSYYDGDKLKSIQADYEDYRRDKKGLLELVLGYYYWLTINQRGSIGSQAGIEFAWEKTAHSEKVRIAANEKAKNTDVLVIIGYSFPTFNRAIDKELLKNMVNLKKVYIQTMEQSMSEVTQRFKALLGRNIEILPISLFTGKEEFYIPYEYIGI